MAKKKPDIYSNKQRWKVLLLILALLIVGGSLIMSNEMVAKISEKETYKGMQWALAIQ